MGITGQFENPEYTKARDAILEACQRHNIVPGIHVVAPEAQQILDRHAKAIAFLAIASILRCLQRRVKVDSLRSGRRLNNERRLL